MSLNLLPTTISSAPINEVLNYDVLTQVIYYSTADATGELHINFRGDSETTFASIVPVGQTLYTMLSVKVGTETLSLTKVTVDGIDVKIVPTMKQFPYTMSPNQTVSLIMNITHAEPDVFWLY